MRDSKGISMISLIVTIICTILIASVAIGTGTKYIRESKNRDKSAFVTIMSNAVARRNSDAALSSTAYPYLGYRIDDGGIFDRVFVPKVNEPIKFEDGLWYVIDTTTAKSLGVKDSEKYIGTVDLGYSEEITLVLADYLSEKVYLIDAYPSEIAGLDSVVSGQVSGHEHSFVDDVNYPNCTEPLKCDLCGFIMKEALGHKYDGTSVPEPALGDEANAHYNRTCIVCNMQGGYEPHKFEFEHFIKNGLWHHKSKCIVCNYPETTPGFTNEERCSEVITLPQDETEKDTSHIHSCNVCGYKVTEPHDIGYKKISEAMHEKYCRNPLCGYRILREYHYDNDGDSICDACGATINSYAQPIFKVVEIENITPISPDRKYVAKYGDTVRLRVEADKAINKETMEVTIAGHVINSASIVTTDNINLYIDFELLNTMTIPNGEIRFSIECESSVGVEMSAPVTTTTNNKMVVFDGIDVTAEYITKSEVAAGTI